MYLSDKQRGKCLEAVAANYEIKRENRAKLKIRLIDLYTVLYFILNVTSIAEYQTGDL